MTKVEWATLLFFGALFILMEGLVGAFALVALALALARRGGSAAAASSSSSSSSSRALGRTLTLPLARGRGGGGAGRARADQPHRREYRYADQSVPGRAPADACHRDST